MIENVNLTIDGVSIKIENDHLIIESKDGKKIILFLGSALWGKIND